MASTIEGFDHLSPSWNDSTLWDAYERLLSAGPAIYSPLHGGYWIISRYSDVKAALRDHETFSSASGHRIPMVDGMSSIPIDYDPPLHTHYRSLLTRALTPDSIRDLRPWLTSMIAEVLASFHQSGGGDAVADVALSIPLRVLTKIVGFSPATVARFRELTEDIWRDGTAESQLRGRAALVEAVDRDIDEHCARRPDDYLTWLLDAEVDGRPIDIGEIHSVLLTLAVAGHETTLNSVSTLLYLLASDSSLQERLRADPGVAPLYVEEMLRLRTPAQMFARRTTREVDVGGTTIPGGSWVLLLNAAANRDFRQFEHPNEFDIHRSARGHLAFGWGIHQCVGSALARSELRILLETLCQYPPITLAADPTFTAIEAGTHFGLRKLPLSFADSAPRS
ncbi:cytochrome P450 [Rhodococcus sp. WAY2]|uniref:cytochrome P450 n=1 Tax=Rhodococcus sp. WAY2 TaxID=2663121 RepID=UPI00131FF7C0|nr:cytochrome P450 [Rhodococcus sp. WAY2]QHE70770.1 putative cytochrome P450 hydroxylase [Rhodococcus sp. WAY2]